jgi:hypothetical protein
MSGYGLAASTMIHLQPRRATTTTTTMRMHELRGKLGIGSTLGPFLSIFVHPDTATRPLPLHTIKGEGGTLNKTRWTTPATAMYWAYSQTLESTHTQRPGSYPSLDQLVSPYYKHFGAKQHEQQRALKVGTFSPNQYKSCVRLAHLRRLRRAASFTCLVSKHPLF